MTPKARTIPDDVLDILKCGTSDGDRYVLPGQLQRLEYTAVDKVLQAAGLKWNRKAKAHVAATGDAAEAIEVLITTGEYLRPADFGQFNTPQALANEVVAMAQIRGGMYVLEPSAGTGNLVRPCLDRGAQVSAVEVQADLFPADLRDCPNVSFWQGDFMMLGADRPRPVFDRVVMNPPFAKRQDINHVLQAVRWLKPEGRLIAIMSAGVLFRQDRLAEDFRMVVDKRGGSIEALPPDSFQSAGTSVNTVMVQIIGGVWS